MLCGRSFARSGWLRAKPLHGPKAGSVCVCWGREIHQLVVNQSTTSRPINQSIDQSINKPNNYYYVVQNHRVWWCWSPSCYTDEFRSHERASKVRRNHETVDQPANPSRKVWKLKNHREEPRTHDWTDERGSPSSSTLASTHRSTQSLSVGLCCVVSSGVAKVGSNKLGGLNVVCLVGWLGWLIGWVS